MLGRTQQKSQFVSIVVTALVLLRSNILLAPVLLRTNVLLAPVLLRTNVLLVTMEINQQAVA
jgi:hypothetical protein